MKSSVYQNRKETPIDDLVEQKDRCPICQSEGPRKSVLSLQKAGPVELLLCSYCRGCSASHMPRISTLDTYYSGYYQADHPMMTFHNPSKLAARILRPIDPRAFGRKTRILDFGGGDGSLSVAIAERLLDDGIAEIVEIDLVDRQLRGVVPGVGIYMNLREGLDMIRGKYDLVLASAILEHIPQLNPVLHRLFSLVHPGGHFYARTPYMAPFAKFIRNLDLTFPGHVHDMGAPFWNRIIRTFELPARIVRSGPSPVETRLSKHFWRTLSAHTLKFPGVLEMMIGGRRRENRIWRLVGGWEIWLTF